MAKKNSTCSSTVAKALREVEKRLNCTKCHRDFTQPKSLPCLHTFCKDCLGHLSLLPQGGSYVLNCPLCCNNVELLEGGISGLPSVFHVNDLLDLKQQLKKLSQVQLTCDNCDDQATGFCRQCGQFFCRRCTDAHLKFAKLFPGHEIAGLSDVISNACNLMPVKQQSVMECPAHKKPMDIYCETCHVLLCQRCTIYQHKEHQCDSINDICFFQKHLQHINDLVSPAKNKLSTLKKLIRALENRSDEITENKNQVKKVIRERSQQLIAEYTAAVEESMQQLTEEVEDVLHEKLGFLSIHKEEAEMAAAMLESSLEYVEGALRIGTKQHILCNKMQMVDRLKLVTSQVNVDSFHPAEEADLKFVEDEQVAAMPTKIGRFEFSTLARKCRVSGEGCTKALLNHITGFQVAIESSSAGDTPSFPVALISCRLQSPCASSPTDCIVKEISTRTYEVTYTPTTRGPHQLRVSVGGKEIQCSPFRVSVSSPPEMRDAPLQTITGLKGSRYVSISREDRLMFTEFNGHCFTIFSKDGKKINSVGSKGSTDNHFDHPTGITTTPDNHILVVDRDNARLQKFTMDGQFVAAIGRRGSGKLQFNHPQSICMHPSGKILVADLNNHRIQVLNPDFSYSHSIGSFGSQQGQFNHPFDVATDSEGTVYVTDSNNDRIQKLTLKGKFLAQFRSELNHPNGITIDENDILYVSNYHFMSVLDTSGRFLKKFGKKGNGDGDFDSPHGVAVDASGNLYVCDYYNNRVIMY